LRGADRLARALGLDDHRVIAGRLRIEKRAAHLVALPPERDRRALAVGPHDLGLERAVDHRLALGSFGAGRELDARAGGVPPLIELDPNLAFVALVLAGQPQNDLPPKAF